MSFAHPTMTGLLRAFSHSDSLDHTSVRYTTSSSTGDLLTIINSQAGFSRCISTDSMNLPASRSALPGVARSFVCSANRPTCPLPRLDRRSASLPCAFRGVVVQELGASESAGLSAPQVRSPGGPSDRGNSSGVHRAPLRFDAIGAVGCGGGRRGHRNWVWSPGYGAGLTRAVPCGTDCDRGGCRRWHRARFVGGRFVPVRATGRLDSRCGSSTRDRVGVHMDVRVRAPRRSRVVGSDGASAGGLQSVAALSTELPWNCAPSALCCSREWLRRSTWSALQGVRRVDTGGSCGDLCIRQPERVRGARLHRPSFGVFRRRM